MAVGLCAISVIITTLPVFIVYFWISIEFCNCIYSLYCKLVLNSMILLGFANTIHGIPVYTFWYFLSISNHLYGFITCYMMKLFSGVFWWKDDDKLTLMKALITGQVFLLCFSLASSFSTVYFWYSYQSTLQPKILIITVILLLIIYIAL